MLFFDCMDLVLINWNSVLQNGSVYPQSTGLANPEPEPEATTATAGTADANVTLPPALAALLANATKGTYSPYMK